LRAAGTTVRSALDVLLAAFCIQAGHTLLHADRDFDAFEATQGLQAWRH
jgi:predicted nucleic acid-binding protein